MFGLSAGEWQAIGIVGGIVIGALGLVVNAAINAYFKSQHLALARRQAGAIPEE
jgi:hypothetical protein